MAFGATFIGVGIGLAVYSVFECVAPQHTSPVFGKYLFAACNGLGNQGYLPLSLLPAVLALQPFGKHRDADEDVLFGIAVISAYMMSLNLLSWTLIHWLVGRQKSESQPPALLPALALHTAQAERSEQGAGTTSLRQGCVRCLSAITPPIAGCLAGIALGLIPPVKALLHSEEGEDLAPLEPTVTAAIKSLGDATVPIVLLQLGATMVEMLTPPKQDGEELDTASGTGGKAAPSEAEHAGGTIETSEESDTAEGGSVRSSGVGEEAVDSREEDEASAAAAFPNALCDADAAPQPPSADQDTAGLDKQDVAIAVEEPPSVQQTSSEATTRPAQTNLPGLLLATSLVTKLVLMPATGLALVVALLEGGVLDPASTSPVLPFIFMLQWSPPTALNLLVMTNLERFAEKEVASVVLTGHIAAAISMTVWITVFITVVNGYYPQ